MSSVGRAVGWSVGSMLTQAYNIAFLKCHLVEGEQAASGIVWANMRQDSSENVDNVGYWTS